MALKEIELVQPAYFERFSCLGPSCTDNCCHDWVITIDKQHYLQYKAVQDPAFQKKCAAAIQRTKGKGDGAFAQMLLQQGERCVFQDEDGGCGIYRLLGPDALSNTCTFYPRIKSQFVPGVWEFSLTLSCEEAARLALFGPGGMEFRRTRCTLDPSSPLAKIPLNFSVSPNRPLADLIPLREGCLSLLRMRSLPLRERVLAVGLLLRRAEQLFQQKQAGQIPAMVPQIVAQAEQGVAGEVFRQMRYSEETHLWALTLPAQHLLHGCKTGGVRSAIWAAIGELCTLEDQNGSGGHLTVGTPALMQLLRLGQQKGDPLLLQFEQAAENYFVNHVFSTPFPFTYITDSCFFEYHGVLLAEQYAMLRMLLSVLPPREGESGEDLFVRAVVALSRVTQHTNLRESAHRYAAEKRLDSLAYSAYLLR